jgi:hypothetical protein
MIKKSSLQPIAQLAGAFLLAGSMAACGDDGGNPPVTPPDAGNGTVPDAGGGGTPDATPCSGHGCPGVDSPFQLAEGGEFRLERFKYDPQNNDDLAAQAFFFSGQEPEFRSLGGTAIPIRAELEALGYECQDFSAGNNFDNGKSPQAQAVVDSREYYDVGASATLTNVNDANDVITLDKFLGETSAADATDLSAGLVHDILYKGSPDTAVSLFTRYTPEIAGSADFPSLDLKFGESAVGDEMADASGNGTPQIYMPGGFTMTSPREQDFYGPQSLVFTKGQDTVLEYTLNDPEPVGQADGYPTIVPFIGFVDDNGMVNAYCLKVTPGVIDDGTFTVPFEVLDFIPAAPTTGYVLFGRFTHVAWEVQKEPVTRLDFLGVECLISAQWVVNEPAAAASK